jgi:hypothetical protein
MIAERVACDDARVCAAVTALCDVARCAASVREAAQSLFVSGYVVCVVITMCLIESNSDHDATTLNLCNATIALIDARGVSDATTSMRVRVRALAERCRAAAEITRAIEVNSVATTTAASYRDNSYDASDVVFNSRGVRANAVDDVVDDDVTVALDALLCRRAPRVAGDASDTMTQLRALVVCCRIEPVSTFCDP